MTGTADRTNYDHGTAPERLIADILSAARPHYWLALAFTVAGWVIL
jgi:hypothetical protein